MGLATRVVDARNYVALTLASSEDAASAQLVEIIDGEPRVLAEDAGPWPVGRWHRLKLDVVGDEVIAAVNGQPVGDEGTLRGRPWGRVGVYAKTDGDCRFDDLHVRGLRLAEPAPEAQPGGPWTFVSGRWKATKGQVSCKAASTAIALASLGTWGRCRVQATVSPAPQADAGVVARWTTSGGYGFTATQAGDEISYAIRRLAPDGDVVLAEGTLPGDAGDAKLSLEADGPALTGWINGECVAKAWDLAHASGSAGLVAIDGKAGFDGFRADEPMEAADISVLLADASGQTRPGATHGAFERFLGDLWQPTSKRLKLVDLDGEPCLALNQQAMRYYLPRPGDVTLSADLLQSDGQQVVLGICADAESRQGYGLSLEGSTLELLKNSEVVASATVTAALPFALSVERDGPFIIGKAGDAIVSFKDEDPLPSGYAIVHSAGLAHLDNVDLGASHALAYRFDRVEPDWEPVSGDWLFHSGMACIPWAHWISADAREEPAMAWNRVPGPGNLTMRFDVSEYTVGHEDGAHDHFAYTDINVVMSAPGKDVDSGYRFCIGEEGGQVSRLYRKGEVVAETRDPRCRVTMGAHCNAPRAMEIIAAKNGPKLTLVLNGVDAIDYEDAEPLGDGWMAIGTANSRANFRDLLIYRDSTWREPIGVASFSP